MQPLLKDAADTIPPTANGHGVDCSRQQVGASEETAVVLVNSDHLTCAKPADSGLTSQERSESNAASDTQQSPPPTDKGEEEAPNQNGAAKDKQKEPVSAGCSSRQLFPPGRIIHMVALPPPADPNPGEGTSSDEVIGIYETPRDLYGKIRLAPNMVKEHYMPSYISTMESLLEQLQKDDGTSSVCVCTASNELWIVVENSVVINPILSHHLIFLSRFFPRWLMTGRCLSVRLARIVLPTLACMPSLRVRRSRPHALTLQESTSRLPWNNSPSAATPPQARLSRTDRHGRLRWWWWCCSPRPRRRPRRRLRVGCGGRDPHQGDVLAHDAPGHLREGHEQAGGPGRRACGGAGAGDVGLRSISSCCVHAFAI